jgi:hypothetical protein
MKKTSTLPANFVLVRADVLVYREKAMSLGTLFYGIAAIAIGIAQAFDNGFFDFSPLQNYLTAENYPQMIFSLLWIFAGFLLIRMQRVVRIDKMTKQFEVVLYTLFPIRLDYAPLRAFDEVGVQKIKRRENEDRYEVSLYSNAFKRRASVSELLSYHVASQHAEALSGFLGLPVVDKVSSKQNEFGPHD